MVIYIFFFFDGDIFFYFFLSMVIFFVLLVTRQGGCYVMYCCVTHVSMYAQLLWIRALLFDVSMFTPS